MELLAEEIEPLQEVVLRTRPHARYFQTWVPSKVGTELVLDGILDRDSAVKVTRLLPGWLETYGDLAEWARTHDQEIRVALDLASGPFMAAMEVILSRDS